MYAGYPTGQNNNIKAVNKFGRNSGLTTSGTAEDIWEGGGDYAFATAAQIYEFTSDSSSDTAAGAGAKTLTIYGLDADYNAQSETITLAGASTVSSTNSYIRLFRATVNTAGATGSNEGVITGVGADESDTALYVAVGANQTQQAIYTIPADYVGFLYNYYGSALRATAGYIDLGLYARKFGEVFALKHEMCVASTGATYARHEFDFPLVFPEKTDLKLRGTSSANNMAGIGGFDILLVHKKLAKDV